MLRLLTRPAVWAGAAAGAVAAVLATQQPAQAAAAVSALSPDEWRAFKLVHKEALTTGVSNKTVLYRFALADKNQEQSQARVIQLIQRAAADARPATAHLGPSSLTRLARLKPKQAKQAAAARCAGCCCW